MSIDSTGLRALQDPLKQRYREDPDAARLTLRARGSLDADFAPARASARVISRPSPAFAPVTTASRPV